MAFHPCCDKTIVAADDNAGNIGIWNVVRLFDFVCVVLLSILILSVVTKIHVVFQLHLSLIIVFPIENFFHIIVLCMFNTCQKKSILIHLLELDILLQSKVFFFIQDASKGMSSCIDCTLVMLSKYIFIHSETTVFFPLVSIDL